METYAINRIVYVFGGLKTTLRFSDLLGLTELSKGVTLMIMVYDSESIQIKISSRKRHIGAESRKQQAWVSSCPLPVE